MTGSSKSWAKPFVGQPTTWSCTSVRERVLQKSGIDPKLIKELDGSSRAPKVAARPPPDLKAYRHLPAVGVVVGITPLASELFRRRWLEAEGA